MKYTCNRNFANEGTQLSWTVKTLEVLGDEFRLIAKWFNEGISLIEYDTLSSRAKAISGYKPQLIESEFRDYQTNIYEPMAMALSVKTDDGNTRARNGGYHNINLDTDFTDG